MELKKEENRIYLESEEGKLLAEIEFEELENKKFNIYHTFVDETLRGQGIASQLMEMAMEEIKAREGMAEATCPYAKAWLEKRQK